MSLEFLYQRYYGGDITLLDKFLSDSLRDIRLPVLKQKALPSATEPNYLWLQVPIAKDSRVREWWKKK